MLADREEWELSSSKKREQSKQEEKSENQGYRIW